MVEIGGGKMREITFRAKRIDNGELVYGAYVTMHHNDGRTHTHHFIIPDGSDLSYGVKVEDILVEVDGESVCQFTGQKDKNGEERETEQEKQNAKTPYYEGDGYYDGEIVYDTWICPNCGEHYEVGYDNYKYCPECGQHIQHADWEQ